MPIAALYDIHGNLPALEAVLEEIGRIRVDQIVIGGDVLPGPMARETLDRLHELQIPVHCIYGNGEIAVLDEIAGRRPRVPELYRPAIRWNGEQLDGICREWIASWPKTCRLTIERLGDVLFCHATPDNENDLFTRLTPDDRLLPIFGHLSVPVVVCGHTHMQFDRMIGNIRVLNAGSVGMPFGRPGADWLLLGEEIQFRHTHYDLTRAAERIRRTAYPLAEEFALNNVIQPPSEDKMLEVFSRAELK
jgi:putative phosphoesterase